MAIDQAIDEVRAGRLSPDKFPPLKVVQHNHGLFSLSNRRLFLFRVLVAQGLADSVRVTLLEPDSEQVRI